MLTKEMIADEMIRLIDRHGRELANRQKWCENVAKLEEATGREFVATRWGVGCDLNVSKQDLPEIRKAIGRFKVAFKMAIERDGKDMVSVTLEPESDDWKPLRFCYEVKYRPGKCKIVEQVSKYKSLVCEV